MSKKALQDETLLAFKNERRGYSLWFHGYPLRLVLWWMARRITSGLKWVKQELV